MVIHRNNTNFPLHLKKFISSIPKNEENKNKKDKNTEIPISISEEGVKQNEESNILSLNRGAEMNLCKDGLTYIQRIVLNYYLEFVDNVNGFDSRGIFAYMSTGSGKTILAISIAENLIPRRKCIFIATTTLHNNAINAIKKYKKMIATLNNQPIPSNEELDEHIKKWYSFVSSNSSNMFQKVSWLSIQVDEQYLKNPKKSKNEIKEGESVEQMFGSLNDKLIIVDEAHDLFNSIVNGSKNATDFYNLVMNTQDIRLLFLSGTPIVNDPFELVPCYNMLSGYLSTTNLKRGDRGNLVPNSEELLGLDYKMFREYFVNRQLNSIQNKDKFQNRIIGLTAYYNVKNDPEILKRYPEQKQTIIEKVPMSGKQYSKYLIARETEIEEIKNASKFKKRDIPLQKPKGSSSSYRINTRQISNCIIPDYAIKTIELEDGRNKQIKLIDEIKNEDLLDLDNNSPKFKKIIENVEKHLSKGEIGLVYSQFVENGIYLFSRVLKALGYSEFTLNKENNQNKKKINREIDENTAPNIDELIILQDTENIKGEGEYKHNICDQPIDFIDDITQIKGAKEKTKDKKDKKKANLEPKTLLKFVNGTMRNFVIISGDVPVEDRYKIFEIMFSPENKYGSIIGLMLISSTGAQGVDGKNIRHVHIMEPYWHWTRPAQVIARAVRMDSHIDLPKNLRVVQPYIYLSDVPSEKILINDKSPSLMLSDDTSHIYLTTDLDLYVKAIKNQMLIDTFLMAIRDASIGYMKMKICSPTNVELFVPKLTVDMRVESPCKKLEEESIKVKPIKYNNHTFYYSKDDNGFIILYDIDKNLGGYIEINAQINPEYNNIIDAIK
ncbi:MAG: DEAD/DEAH box helicase family protein [Propionibacteriaceae bacterium]|nr:DEAD/DEAH box helicase family protein [Propionibacteriaceae bacterium]